MAHETTGRLQHWLDRLRDGDPAARAELIRHAQDRLLTLARQFLRAYPRLRAWEESSDVLQNVLVRLDRALAGPQQVATPRDLLGLAAALIRRELIDLARHYYGPLGVGRHAVGTSPPDRSDTTLDPARLARWEGLHEYIAARPADERALFDLLYYQGLDQSAAAALLHLSLRTLKRHWQQARLALMDAIGDDFCLL